MVSLYFNNEFIAILSTIDIMEKDIQVEIKQEKKSDSNPFTYSGSPCNY